MEFDFSVIETPEDKLLVTSPQLCSYKNKYEEWVVEVLFMENSAALIAKGFAKPVMGKVVLEYQAEFPSSAVTASVKLFKVKYIFPYGDGMQKNFEFKGGKSITRRSKMDSENAAL